MKNKLQYAYSITVFCGVLVSAYLMMSRDASSRSPYQTFESPSTRVEASMVDPAVSSLFEAESALNNMPGQKSPELRRTISQTKTVLELKKRVVETVLVPAR